MLQFLVVISQKFCCGEEACGYLKVIHEKEKKGKKEKEKSIEKMDKCLRYPKQWVLRCPPKRKEKRDK
jgi:hypothetical protein